jgi:threonine synthase
MQDKINHAYGFVSGASTHQDRLNTIKTVYAAGDGFIDPHTADGIKVAREVREAGETIVCLETALATKFDATVHEALGSDVMIPRPQALADLESREQFVSNLPNSVDAVKAFMREKLASA